MQKDSLKDLTQLILWVMSKLICLSSEPSLCLSVTHCDRKSSMQSRVYFLSFKWDLTQAAQINHNLQTGLL